jgi:3-mercaptopyruvate sulfurtransferase SseA
VAGLALRIAGYKNVLVYEGSIYEWSRNPQLELVSGMDDFIIEAASVEDGDCG